MNALIRNRGVHSVRAEFDTASLLADLNTNVNNFRERHTQEIRNVSRGLDDVMVQVAALRLGGVGTGEQPQTRRAQAAVVEFMRTGRPDAMMSINPQSAMSTDSNPNGGFTVPTEIDGVVQSLMIPYSPMRALANVVSVNTSDYHKIINQRGASSGWVGETDDRPETQTPLLADISPSQGEVYANAAITQWALDDSQFKLDAFIQENVVDEFTSQENSAFVTGNGVKKPLGFLAVPTSSADDASRLFGTIQYIPTGNATGLVTNSSGSEVADVLFDLVYKLKAQYREGPGVGWQMNSLSLSRFRKLKDYGGNYILQDLDAGTPSNLCGYPVYVNENMPDFGANAFPIAFGNWNRAYIIVDRMGVRILRDPFTKPGWVKFYMTKRVGGAPADTNAIKLLKVATS